MSDALHAAIVNLPCKAPSGYPFGSELCQGVYREGHRDARHAAAELVAAATSAQDAQIATLQRALRNLLDEQNGAPLIKREEQWQKAVDDGYAALAATGERT